MTVAAIARPVTVLALLVALGATPAAAQAGPIGPASSCIWRAASNGPSDTASATPHANFHLEGAVIGGGSLGVLGAFMGYDLCSTSDTHHGSCAGNALGLGLVGAVIGWTTGSLIGGLIPKGP